MKMFKKNKKGFTLVELIIVVAVLAVLAAIAVPVAGNLTATARGNSDAANAKLYQSAVENNAANGNGYPATALAAVQLIVAQTDIPADVATFPVPQQANRHFYYNTTDNVVSVKASAGANDVQLDGVDPTP